MRKNLRTSKIPPRKCEKIRLRKIYKRPKIRKRNNTYIIVKHIRERMMMHDANQQEKTNDVMMKTDSFVIHHTTILVSPS